MQSAMKTFAVDETSVDMCPQLQEENPEINAVGNYGPPRPRINPYANNYEPPWRNNLNLRYGNNENFQQQRQFEPRLPYQQDRSPSTEDLIHSLATNLGNHVDATMKQFKQIETNICLLTQAMVRFKMRESGCLPSNTEVNPKGNFNAVLKTRVLQRSTETEISSNDFEEENLQNVYAALRFIYAAACTKVTKLFPKILQMNVKSEARTTEESSRPASTFPRPAPNMPRTASTFLAKIEEIEVLPPTHLESTSPRPVPNPAATRIPDSEKASTDIPEARSKDFKKAYKIYESMANDESEKELLEEMRRDPLRAPYLERMEKERDTRESRSMVT